MLRAETTSIQTDLKFSLWNGETVLGLSTEAQDIHFFGELNCWRIDTDGSLREQFSTATPAGGLRLAQSSSSESVVVTAHTDAALRVWSLVQPATPDRSLLFHGMAVEDVSASPYDGSVFASGAKDGVFAVWDITQEQPLWSGHGANAEPFIQLAFHPHMPQLLVAAPLDGRIEFWHMPSRRRMDALQPHGEDTIASSMALNPYDENALAVGDERGHVVLWDLRSTRAPSHVLHAHTAPITALQYCPHDTKILAAATADGQTHMWHTGEEDTPPQCMRSYRSHQLSTTALDWSVHSIGLLATAGGDYSVCMWNIADQRLS
uniref:Peroxin-7 n=1 Tax=Malawimonas jakobiformis TaxID=136089 RepID=A0A895KR44_MALJA|nr:Gsp-co-occurring protein 2b [Malawimonas jakobiformis]